MIKEQIRHIETNINGTYSQSLINSEIGILLQAEPEYSFIILTLIKIVELYL